MDADAISSWFVEYLEAFAACGRGESEPDSLLAYYGVPLLLTTDDGLMALTTDDQVVAVMRQQAQGMRAADYHHSVILRHEVTVINAASALYRGEFSRQRRDGEEVSHLTATYLITDGPAGRRISALAVHTP